MITIAFKFRLGQVLQTRAEGSHILCQSSPGMMPAQLPLLLPLRPLELGSHSPHCSLDYDDLYTFLQGSTAIFSPKLLSLTSKIHGQVYYNSTHSNSNFFFMVVLFF